MISEAYDYPPDSYKYVTVILLTTNNTNSTSSISLNNTNANQSNPFLQAGTLPYNEAQNFIIQLEIDLQYWNFNDTTGTTILDILEVQSFYHYEECCLQYGASEFGTKIVQNKEEIDENVEYGTYVRVTYQTKSREVSSDFNSFIGDYVVQQKNEDVTYQMYSSTLALEDAYDDVMQLTYVLSFTVLLYYIFTTVLFSNPQQQSQRTKLRMILIQCITYGVTYGWSMVLWYLSDIQMNAERMLLGVTLVLVWNLHLPAMVRPTGLKFLSYHGSIWTLLITSMGVYVAIDDVNIRDNAKVSFCVGMVMYLAYTTLVPYLYQQWLYLPGTPNDASSSSTSSSGAALSPAMPFAHEYPKNSTSLPHSSPGETSLQRGETMTSSSPLYQNTRNLLRGTTRWYAHIAFALFCVVPCAYYYGIWTEQSSNTVWSLNPAEEYRKSRSSSSHAYNTFMEILGVNKLAKYQWYIEGTDVFSPAGFHEVQSIIQELRYYGDVSSVMHLLDTNVTYDEYYAAIEGTTTNDRMGLNGTIRVLSEMYNAYDDETNNNENHTIHKKKKHGTPIGTSVYLTVYNDPYDGTVFQDIRTLLHRIHSNHTSWYLLSPAGMEYDTSIQYGNVYYPIVLLLFSVVLYVVLQSTTDAIHVFVPFRTILLCVSTILLTSSSLAFLSHQFNCITSVHYTVPYLGSTILCTSMILQDVPFVLQVSQYVGSTHTVPSAVLQTYLTHDRDNTTGYHKGTVLAFALVCTLQVYTCTEVPCIKDTALYVGLGTLYSMILRIYGLVLLSYDWVWYPGYHVKRRMRSNLTSSQVSSDGLRLERRNDINNSRSALVDVMDL